MMIVRFSNLKQFLRNYNDFDTNSTFQNVFSCDFEGRGGGGKYGGYDDDRSYRAFPDSRTGSRTEIKITIARLFSNVLSDVVT